jgi:hypothetical protein
VGLWRPMHQQVPRQGECRLECRRNVRISVNFLRVYRCDWPGTMVE